MLAILAILTRRAARLPSPRLRAVLLALSGREGKAGASVELESGFRDAAGSMTVSCSGLSVTAVIGVQSRVLPLHRRGLDRRACR